MTINFANIRLGIASAIIIVISLRPSSDKKKKNDTQ